MRLRPLTRRLFAAAGVATFGAAVGLAGATATITMKSTLNGALGSTILVNSAGRTLYHDGAEKKNAVKCVAACAREWLPLVVTAGAKPVAGTGVAASKVGVLQRPDGKMQVTYAGLPLYLYAGDSKAGQVNGQGVGGIWHVIAPTGVVITRSAKSTSTPATGGASSVGVTSSGGGTSGGGSSSGGATSPGGGMMTPSGCDTNPNGYGCM